MNGFMPPLASLPGLPKKRRHPELHTFQRRRSHPSSHTRGVLFAATAPADMPPEDAWVWCPVPPEPTTD
jgi:hypothetical protein